MTAEFTPERLRDLHTLLDAHDYIGRSHLPVYREDLRALLHAHAAYARLQTAHATQSAELQAMREERDRCCDDYQREAQRAVEAEHRITALQAQLAEARGRAIEECAQVVGAAQRERRAEAKRYEDETLVAIAAGLGEAVLRIRALAQREPSEATQEGGGDG